MTFQRQNARAAKATNEQVIQIRQRYAAGESQGSLARDFKLSVGQIGRIVRGESRQNLPLAEEGGRYRGQAIEPTDDEIKASQERLDKLIVDLNSECKLNNELNELIKDDKNDNH